MVPYSALNSAALHLQPTVHSIPYIQTPMKFSGFFMVEDASLNLSIFRTGIEFIGTKYNPRLHEHAPYSKLDHPGRYSFTEKEREKAEQAVSISSVEEFHREVGLVIDLIDSRN